MNTDELVVMLATGDVAVERNAAARSYATKLGVGVLGSAVLMLVLMGVRPDLHQAVALPMFWIKLAFVVCLSLASVLLALRLATPGTALGWAPGVLVAPVIAMWILAALILAGVDPAQRSVLFYGSTWARCPLIIATLSVPVFMAMVWAMRGLAPTRLRLAGAGAGLVAGSLGALVYSVHCTEMSAPFLGIWYLLGLLIPTGAGVLLGPRLLRW